MSNSERYYPFCINLGTDTKPRTDSKIIIHRVERLEVYLELK